jgi:hypothetical protein
MWILWLVLACQTTNTPPVVEDTPVADETLPLTLKQEPGVLGQLVANEKFSQTHPSEYVLENGHLYQGTAQRIGSLNIMPAPGLDASEHLGQLVLVTGRKSGSLYSALKDLGPVPSDYGRAIPMAQMRSDWVSPEGGYRTTRAKLETLPVFFAKTVRTVNLGEEITQTDETTQIRLTNPFNIPMTGLDAQVHYEGGPGKPMPTMRPLDLNIPAGGTQTLTIANIVEEPAGRQQVMSKFRLQSVDIKGSLGKTEVEFSIWVPNAPFKRR